MSDQPSSEPHDPYAAFRHRPFWIYVSSYVLAVVSSAMLSFAAKFQVNELTRNAEHGPDYYLGLLGATGAIPIIFLSLFAGHVVDRFNRKYILLITQAILSICPAVFAILAWGGVHSVWTIYAIVLVNGSTLAFARPARTAMISSLVPRKDLGNAITWNSTFFETSAAIGPAFAGLTIAGGGLSVAMLVCAAFTATCLFMSLALPNPAAPVGEGREPLSWGSLMSGFRFVYRTRLLFAVMSLDLFAVLFGGATYLMPRFADRLGVGAFGLGCMVAAPGVGAIVMALSQAHLPPFKRAGWTMLVAVVTFGIATIVFGLSRSLYVSLATLLVMGAADNISVIVRHSLVQLLTPDAMRGRVSAVNQVFIGSSNELGGFESGMTAKLFGSPVTSVVVGGAAVLAVVAAIAARFPEVRRLGKLHEVEAPPEPPEMSKSTMSLD